jgi:CRISPR-associated endonuclease/helicase Cas3
MCAVPEEVPLAISTLRGQFADNREWSADPSRPAVIVGTVDMIGSRLLFSGYGVGFKGKPLHAGFLGQDALLVHDEAHLEPAFQKLIESIRHEQSKEPAPLGEQMRLKIMALSATPRGSGEPFGLTKEEKSPPDRLPEELTEPVHFVWQRLKARKGIAFQTTDAEKEKVAERVGKVAKGYADSGKAVLVYVNSLEAHATVCRALKGENVEPLTGTMRGLERDLMADPRKESGSPIFARFLKPPRSDADDRERWKVEPTRGTVYLICTSAGEVGIDISADHLVCDLTTYERMAQRFGRVNRYGTGDANIDVVHESVRDVKKAGEPYEQARWNTLELLKGLTPQGDRWSASPLALMRQRDRGDLKSSFDAAYTPRPAILPVTDILFDAWALTSIRDKLPGRPPVEPYLHGLAARDLPETHVAWREEVERITPALSEYEELDDLLEDYPLKPHELLRDRSDRVFKCLESLAVVHSEKPVWLIDDDGIVQVYELGALADKDRKDRIDFRTVLLSPTVGGLKDGLLTGSAEDAASDVADEWKDENYNPRRKRVWDGEPAPWGMRLVRTIDLSPDPDMASEEDELDEEHAARKRFWRWHVRPYSADDDGSKTSVEPVTWCDHTDDVTRNTTQIIRGLELPEEMERAFVVAARHHDLGKKRPQWQRSIGNYATLWLAKSGKPTGRQSANVVDVGDYRHEFGSLIDVQAQQDFQALNEDMKDLVLHLIAAHHGRARPHFPAQEVFDFEPKGADVERLGAEVPQRFAKLQRRYGRWGLAYLESLLRAADYAASAKPKRPAGDKA